MPARAYRTVCMSMKRIAPGTSATQNARRSDSSRVEAVIVEPIFPSRYQLRPVLRFRSGAVGLREAPSPSMEWSPRRFPPGLPWTVPPAAAPGDVLGRARALEQAMIGLSTGTIAAWVLAGGSLEWRARGKSDPT